MSRNRLLTLIVILLIAIVGYLYMQENNTIFDDAADAGNEAVQEMQDEVDDLTTN